MAVTQPFKKEKPLLARCHHKIHHTLLIHLEMLVVSSGFFSAALVVVSIATAFAVSSNSRTIQRYKKGKTKDCFIHTNELLSHAFFEYVSKKCARVRASFNALCVSIQG